MSKEVDRWIHDDGPEPEQFRAFLDALRNPPPVAAGGAPPAARRVPDVTLRCAVAELVAMAPPSAADPGPPLSTLPPQLRAVPLSLPQVVRPPAALVETARSMEWAVPRAERGGRRRPGGVGVVPFPPMTVVQYASLCAELAMWPGWTGAILGKYGVVGEEARGALDDHWQARWKERPEERAEFEWAFGEYTAWLREHAGQGR